MRRGQTAAEKNRGKGKNTKALEFRFLALAIQLEDHVFRNWKSLPSSSKINTSAFWPCLCLSIFFFFWVVGSHLQLIFNLYHICPGLDPPMSIVQEEFLCSLWNSCFFSWFLRFYSQETMFASHLLGFHWELYLEYCLFMCRSCFTHV